MESNSFLTPYQVRDMLQLSTTATYDLCKSGQFKVLHVGKNVRIERDSFFKWLAKNTH